MPPGVYARKPRPAAPRFWSKVDKSGGPDACWPWLAGKNDEGYGTFYLDGRTHRAHRVAYRWANGPVPDGFVLDHLCRMPSCVNPAHLEPVTNQENIKRGVQSALRPPQTHCKRGHEFTPENTLVHKNKRGCRTCARANERRRRAVARGHDDA